MIYVHGIISVLIFSIVRVWTKDDTLALFLALNGLVVTVGDDLKADKEKK